MTELYDTTRHAAPAICRSKHAPSCSGHISCYLE